MVPFDDKSPFVTSGIRIGTPAITSRGLREAQIKKVVNLIDRVLKSPEDEKVISKTKGDVNEMMKAYPLY